jgi:hypothetical protein
MLLTVPGSMQDYRVDYNGYSKAMRLAGFPEAVIKKYPIKMMMDPLNWGFANKVGDSVKAFVKEDHLVAFVKPSLELISTEGLMKSAVKVLGDEALVERIDHNLSYTNCSLILGSVSREWADERLNDGHSRRNDVVVGGINFTNSLMGESPLEVSGYVYRLICSNGMVSAETKFKWSRKTETTPLTEWFEERLTACKEGLEHEFEKIDQMIQTPLAEGHKADVLGNVFAQYELSDKMRHAVLKRLTDAPPRHMWDVVNAITNVANDEDYVDNPHTIRRLQMIGGDMATKLHVCQACHSVSRN